MRNLKGLAIAGAILASWGAALATSLTVGAATLPVVAWVPAIAVLTFLHTGLFITAHDAMHGSVAPDFPRLNDAIGRVATLLYALFSYHKLTRKHRRHHARPVEAGDPDYHDEPNERFLRWYFGFLGEYVGGWQIVGMAVVYNVLHHLAGVDLLTLNLFWVLPALASTLQLFTYGTYLPHRTPDEGHDDEHRATSNAYSTAISFVTCYHFGYHHEHHRHPNVPWWRLPTVRHHGG